MVMGLTRMGAISFLFATVVLGLSRPTPAANPIIVTSPDGKVKVELSAADGTVRYRVMVDRKQILAPSRIGVLSNGVELGEDAVLGKPRPHKVNEQYKLFGAHSVAVNRAEEATVPVRSHGESFLVDVHVADDGVGVRLRLSAQPGRKVQADHSSWTIEGDPVVWAAQLDAAYESQYKTTSLQKLGSYSYGLPITARIGDIYVTLTEAALKDYGDLAVRRGAGGALEGQLYADPEGWTTDDAVIQPWRVTIIARDLTDLVNSTLVQNLNPPAEPQLVKADWIVPGRSAWQWMAIGDPQFEDQKEWVDWTNQLGFEYYLVDEGWNRWKDAWTSLASVASYAKTRNVKVWLWVHSNELKDSEARKAYFRKTVEAGIVGVKIDFPHPSNRWWSTWYHNTTRDAAEFKLLVDFHGASKPTGMERTWPNQLTREGVRGHEWHMTRYKRVLQPAHDTILPFTRYIAGPGDYTPTVFEKGELQGNTWAHELAQMVIYTSPFLCTGGHPRDYVANPARDVLSAIPAVWDETRVLNGSEPGKVVAVARRSGTEWFIAVINGGEATSLDIPLGFLRDGNWKAIRLYDTKDKPDAWDRQDGATNKADHIQLNLLPRGGFVAWLRK
jgi:alpha-glucosidase